MDRFQHIGGATVATFVLAAAWAVSPWLAVALGIALLVSLEARAWVEVVHHRTSRAPTRRDSDESEEGAP